MSKKTELRTQEIQFDAGRQRCNHGIEFNEAEAQKILGDWESKNTIEFIMGNPNHAKVRERFPRLHGMCPKGCGFSGIAYASKAHFVMGDW